ncbi:beta-mannosidase [Psychroserpens sp.]|uniref:beta-mannosidase n=1 Tax=Psychroserpens sp. TaxID=2020870 RepID=UPI001B23947E|nr:glycoside hydrolase family 2 protein [Psychroserpens sp.]MBO6606812.1 glycoside hydrolase family 2 protein [Psychroserpens sp.]MBO6653515.1 glycoside hydrolase family 2 protein [Psychroserpens sp.]MBO6680457.1 glycoside hydrolase family 2 protein [Psychroserpens sp.]MBO6750584.1 glycoside hydrolase family 2 protein [Psychroserpens sp.]MBO6915067.1 glycoside hydrolase family 2 protein [Psychroserpens sp.]
MNKYFIISIVIIVLFSCTPKHDVPVTTSIDNNWKFKSMTDSIWFDATVPGNIHSDLLRHNIIPHPFIGANEDSIQWVSKNGWDYKTRFNIDQNILEQQHIELNIEGLDTYAVVALNDSVILKSDNAFRSHSIDIKTLLKPSNKLELLFLPTEFYEKSKASLVSYQLPEGNRIFTRKAQFQYGWDWGPILNTSGIWKPISITSWNDFKFQNVHTKITELSDSIAHISFDVRSNNSFEKPVSYEVFVNDELHKIFEDIPIDSIPDLNISIENPRLWWPHNLGEPYLYDLKLIAKDNRRILDSIAFKKGLRTVELITEKDSLGESFYFKINKVPVYMKGANYIPQNSMQNQVIDSHYERLLSDVVDANMNMLRVWGGGIYENDIFYELCDEKGILIWQDFMFACAMYPGDEAFLNNVRIEAQQQVERLRNYASVVLWCGNNESSEGWHRWGWQSGRSEKEKTKIWNNYLKLFDSVLPNTVNKMTDIPYWESSPKYGRGNPKYEFEGDAHDWWVWHDAYPFEHFEEKVPRFMSEFGFQSFPSYEAIRYINQNDTIEITSEGFKNHQKHHRGFELIDTYMSRDYPVPTNAEDHVYVSQLLQAYGMTKGIEAHRRAKPYNMGTLYWQLNDCWPVVSWSSIDFFGNWKALHYKAKKSFYNTIVSTKRTNSTLEFHIINDELKEIEDQLNISVIDFDGKEVWNAATSVLAPANSSEVYYSLSLENPDLDKRSIVIMSTFNDQTRLTYLVRPKDLNLKEGAIDYDINKTETGFDITLQSTTLQKDVFLDTKAKGHFSDNYFDLIPNESVTISFTSKNETLDDLRVRSLNRLIESTPNGL